MTRTRTAALAAAVAAALLAAPPARGAAAGDPVAALARGKEVFEKTCGLCHSLERSLARRDGAAGWLQTVKRMVTYGAPVPSAERPGLVRYLAARSAFETGCSRCHEVTRVVADAPGPRDWTALTARMAAHLEELGREGKAPAGDAFTPGDLEDIAALLQVVIPK